MDWKHACTALSLIAALCLSGCSGLWNRTRTQADDKKIVEENLGDPQASSTGGPQTGPASTDPPAPPVSVTPPIRDPGERPPRRIKRDPAGGWK